MVELETGQALVEETRRLLSSVATPTLWVFLSEWPSTRVGRHDPPGSLPVLRWLPAAAEHTPPFGRSLAAALIQHASALAWRQSYSKQEADARFLDNYGWVELIGRRGLIESEKLACGFLLLGPDTLYPTHRHEAEEVYLPLSGAASWQQGQEPWREWAPGTLIHHESEEPHAMRTGPDPLLALYLWRGGGLARSARLDPPGAR